MQPWVVNTACFPAGWTHRSRCTHLLCLCSCFLWEPSPCNRKIEQAQQTRAGSLNWPLPRSSSQVVVAKWFLSVSLTEPRLWINLPLCKTHPQVAFVNINPSVCYPTTSPYTRGAKVQSSRATTLQLLGGSLLWHTWMSPPAVVQLYRKKKHPMNKQFIGFRCITEIMLLTFEGW